MISGNSDFDFSKGGIAAGVIVDPRGYIVTNYHAVEGDKKIHVITCDDTEYVGQCVGHELATDIALIKISPDKPLVPIRVGKSSKIYKLQSVVAMGHPFGYSFSFTSGEISGLNRKVVINEKLTYSNMIQFSSSISPGHSGGPLLNSDGEMIGQIVALRQGSVIAFALPSDFVMEIAAKLLEQHTIASDGFDRSTGH